jgi:ATP-dependent helicase HrpA
LSQIPFDLTSVLSQDKFKLLAQWRRIEKLTDDNKKSDRLEALNTAVERSIEKKATKIKNLPDITYPPNLPVSQKHEEIKSAIADNQVVIIAGETGSGKTTQIPKMCLELGRGIGGKIGHTQPRRLAARTVAQRISDELGAELGQAVGYKVRFNDQVSDNTYIKLMTDGVLLAELQHDRYLNQYDTLIIDEAHERSLNIDFILGLLKDLLLKRKDLKVIITSATIDPERFSQHFFNAPIISVSGRTFPVEVRYRPIDETEIDNDLAEQYRDSDQINAIFSAVKELDKEEHGDILLFLSGEREIRDTADALTKLKLRNTEVLPLYARLSAAEQNRIFAPHSKRHIVLATNVAETSLTVPGIKYVIDPGTARISRYSYKTKVQRLPIEPISQASANQRMGRCGRTQNGICIRLYSEDDFLSRPEFTAPEILRTNLASVILQMLSLDLGDIEQFPFIQKPDSRFINDGMRLLEELGAIDKSVNAKRRGKRSSKNANSIPSKSTKHGSSALSLTPLGKKLSRIPLDPRLATMVANATQTNALHEVVIIATALSIQDPKERPADFKQKSDELHKRFIDKDSDFNAFLNLWDYLITLQNSVSRSQFRKRCKEEFLSYIRIREWQDLVFQIESTLADLGIKSQIKMAKENTVELDDDFIDTPTIERNYSAIHQPILTGLLSHIGQKIVIEGQGKGKGQEQSLTKERDQKIKGGYQGARNSVFHIFPGSYLFKNKPKWLMSAELVETSKLYARYNAKIQSEWLESAAQHLVNRSYAEPHWDSRQGAVYAYETQTLYGLVIVGRKKVLYSAIDPETSQHLFIQHALVYGEWGKGRVPAFLQRNLDLIDEIKSMENKTRRRDVLCEESDLIDYYKRKLPTNVNNKPALNTWIKENNADSLLATLSDFALIDKTSESAVFPDVWKQNGITLPLEYDFEPGQEFADGISVKIPLALLNQIDPTGFDWLIAPHRHELFAGLIKTLPKQLRRNFVPAPNYADALLQRFNDKNVSIETPLLSALSEGLFRMTGVRVEQDQWEPIKLPDHLKMNFRVVDGNGKIMQQGFDLEAIKNALQGKVKESLTHVVNDDIEQTNITDWNFGELPKVYTKKQHGYEVKAFPALTVNKSSIDIELLESESIAEQKHLEGVVALLLKTLPSPIKHLQKNLPNKSKLVLYFNPFGQVEGLIKDCVKATIKEKIINSVPRNEAEFYHVQKAIEKSLNDDVLETTLQVEKILAIGHQVSKQLKGKVSLDMMQSNGLLITHLNSLIYKDFVSESGVSKLPDILRYIKALEVRVEKIKIDPNKDRQSQIELDKLSASYQEQLKKLPRGASLPPELEEIKWMIEELRVSFFAQSLGTKYPISAKRIKQAMSAYIGR